MKKSLLVASVLLMPVVALFAQNHDPDSAKVANFVISSQFNTDFPDAKDVHFARVKNLNKMYFKQERQKMSAYYDDRGQLVGTIRQESFADLPDNAQKGILHKYPDYVIADVVRFDDNESDDTERMVYGISMNDADNYFVELRKNNKEILVEVDLSGEISYLATIN
jgi:hypothetical protein